VRGLAKLFDLFYGIKTDFLTAKNASGHKANLFISLPFNKTQE
jgi:hypothetical protein